MKQAWSRVRGTAVAVALVLSFGQMAVGQQAGTVARRVIQPVDLAKVVTLRGNTHPWARPEFDRGVAPDGQSMNRILLVLQRSPQQEAALGNLLLEQQVKSSPNYRMWLTPEQFGQQFGPADADLQAVTDWLTSAGFQVNRVAAGRTVIEFSGTAGAVRQAFHTEMHRYLVNGEEHWANSSDPQIPAALAPVVAGFASLNNFPRKPRVRHLGTFSRSKATGQTTPQFTYPYQGGYELAVGPADFATIYNVAPLWKANIDGTGQAIAVAELTDINMQDVADFRSMFGLPANAAQSNALCSPGPQAGVPVNLCLNGPDPGITDISDESEATLDVQWAGAVAKGVTVDMVVSEETETTLGIDLSTLYIIDNDLAPIMSLSYGMCEAFNGAGENQFYNTIYEQGAAEGITIVVANGDSGSAGCDDSTVETAAENGLAVSGNASTPFNVAVGGTDFNDSADLSTYWSQTNTISSTGTAPTQYSALSYIPEMTWNDTCAASGSLTGCASGVASDGSDLVAGSGGPSNCVNPTTNTNTGAISCVKTNGITGNPKPSWQTGSGVPQDQVRDTPDLSLFAGTNANFSFYIYCQMDANTGSTSSCDLNSPYTDFAAAGGTSFAAPAFAGIMAMVNQKTGERQGNANYVLYPMAAASEASCGSNPTMAPTASSSSCIFYDIQSGNNSVACQIGSLNCSTSNTAAYGVMVNPNNKAQPAWTTSAGYDLATGLGSVNAANLVNGWSNYVGTFAPTSTTLSITPSTLTHGQSVTVQVGVTSNSGTPTGDVSLLGGPSGGPQGIAYLTLSSGAVSEPTVFLPGGTYNVTAHYAGDGVHGASDSSPVSVTVSPENSETLVQVLGFNCNGPVGPVTSLVYGASITCTTSTGGSAVYGTYLLRVDVTNSSGNLCYNSTTGVPAYQCPTGAVTVTNNGGKVVDVGAPSGYTGTYTLNSQGSAEDQFIQLPGGTDNLSATYQPHPIAPNNSYNSSSGTATITVSPANTATVVTANQTTISAGSSVILTATVSTSSLGVSPTGTVAFYNGSNLINGTPTYTYFDSAYTATSLSYATLMATLTTTFSSNANVTAQYTPAPGDNNYSSSATTTGLAITISSGTPDFSLTATPSSFTITSPGASGSTAISASAVNNFSGTITLSCSLQSTMSYSTCSLTPTSFTLPGGGPATLTVSTTAASSALRRFNPPWWMMPSAGLLLACTLLLFFPGRKRRPRLAFSLLIAGLLAAALVACGGSSNNTVVSNPGTPTGTYTATVTATNGTLTHPLNIAVTVQ